MRIKLIFFAKEFNLEREMDGYHTWEFKKTISGKIISPDRYDFFSFIIYQIFMRTRFFRFFFRSQILHPVVKKIVFFLDILKGVKDFIKKPFVFLISLGQEKMMLFFLKVYFPEYSLEKEDFESFYIFLRLFLETFAFNEDIFLEEEISEIWFELFALIVRKKITNARFIRKFLEIFLKSPFKFYQSFLGFFFKPISFLIGSLLRLVLNIATFLYSCLFSTFSFILFLFLKIEQYRLVLIAKILAKIPFGDVLILFPLRFIFFIFTLWAFFHFDLLFTILKKFNFYWIFGKDFYPSFYSNFVLSCFFLLILSFLFPWIRSIVKEEFHELMLLASFFLWLFLAYVWIWPIKIDSFFIKKNLPNTFMHLLSLFINPGLVKDDVFDPRREFNEILKHPWGGNFTYLISWPGVSYIYTGLSYDTDENEVEPEFPKIGRYHSYLNRRKNFWRKIFKRRRRFQKIWRKKYARSWKSRRKLKKVFVKIKPEILDSFSKMHAENLEKKHRIIPLFLNVLNYTKVGLFREVPIDERYEEYLRKQIYLKNVGEKVIKDFFKTKERIFRYEKIWPAGGYWSNLKLRKKILYNYKIYKQMQKKIKLKEKFIKMQDDYFLGDKKPISSKKKKKLFKKSGLNYFSSYFWRDKFLNNNLKREFREKKKKQILDFWSLRHNNRKERWRKRMPNFLNNSFSVFFEQAEKARRNRKLILTELNKKNSPLRKNIILFPKLTKRPGEALFRWDLKRVHGKQRYKNRRGKFISLKYPNIFFSKTSLKNRLNLSKLEKEKLLKYLKKDKVKKLFFSKKMKNEKFLQELSSKFSKKAFDRIKTKRSNFSRTKQNLQVLKLTRLNSLLRRKISVLADLDNYLKSNKILRNSGARREINFPSRTLGRRFFEYMNRKKKITEGLVIQDPYFSTDLKLLTLDSFNEIDSDAPMENPVSELIFDEKTLGFFSKSDEDFEKKPSILKEDIKGFVKKLQKKVLFRDKTYVWGKIVSRNKNKLVKLSIKELGKEKYKFFSKGVLRKVRKKRISNVIQSLIRYRLSLKKWIKLPKERRLKKKALKYLRIKKLSGGLRLAIIKQRKIYKNKKKILRNKIDFAKLSLQRLGEIENESFFSSRLYLRKRNVLRKYNKLTWLKVIKWWFRNKKKVNFLGKQRKRTDEKLRKNVFKQRKKNRLFDYKVFANRQVAFRSEISDRKATLMKNSSQINLGGKKRKDNFITFFLRNFGRKSTDNFLKEDVFKIIKKGKIVRKEKIAVVDKLLMNRFFKIKRRFSKRKRRRRRRRDISFRKFWPLRASNFLNKKYFIEVRQKSFRKSKKVRNKIGFLDLEQMEKQLFNNLILPKKKYKAKRRKIWEISPKFYKIGGKKKKIKKKNKEKFSRIQVIPFFLLRIKRRKRQKKKRYKPNKVTFRQFSSFRVGTWLNLLEENHEIYKDKVAEETYNKKNLLEKFNFWKDTINLELKETEEQKEKRKDDLHWKTKKKEIIRRNKKIYKKLVRGIYYDRFPLEFEFLEKRRERIYDFFYDFFLIAPKKSKESKIYNKKFIGKRIRKSRKYLTRTRRYKSNLTNLAFKRIILDYPLPFAASFPFIRNNSKKNIEKVSRTRFNLPNITRSSKKNFRKFFLRRMSEKIWNKLPLRKTRSLRFYKKFPINKKEFLREILIKKKDLFLKKKSLFDLSYYIKKYVALQPLAAKRKKLFVQEYKIPLTLFQRIKRKFSFRWFVLSDKELFKKKMGEIKKLRKERKEIEKKMLELIEKTPEFLEEKVSPKIVEKVIEKVLPTKKYRRKRKRIFPTVYIQRVLANFNSFNWWKFSNGYLLAHFQKKRKKKKKKIKEKKLNGQRNFFFKKFLNLKKKAFLKKAYSKNLKRKKNLFKLRKKKLFFKFLIKGKVQKIFSNLNKKNFSIPKCRPRIITFDEEDDSWYALFESVREGVLVLGGFRKKRLDREKLLKIFKKFPIDKREIFGVSTLSNLTSRWVFFKNYLKKVKKKKEYLRPFRDKIERKKQSLKYLVILRKNRRKNFLRKEFLEDFLENQPRVNERPDLGVEIKRKKNKKRRKVYFVFLKHLRSVFFNSFVKKAKALKKKRKLRDRLRLKKKKFFFFKLLGKNPYRKLKKKKSKVLRKMYFKEKVKQSPFGRFLEDDGKSLWTTLNLENLVKDQNLEDNEKKRGKK